MCKRIPPTYPVVSHQMLQATGWSVLCEIVGDPGRVHASVTNIHEPTVVYLACMYATWPYAGVRLDVALCVIVRDPGRMYTNATGK